MKKGIKGTQNVVFQHRRSSLHLQDAETDLDLRAKTLLGLPREQVEKIANFDKEYFKQLSKSPTGPFPAINSSGVIKRQSEKSEDCLAPQQTAYFIDNHAIDKDRMSAMELRRAYTNLTTTRNKTERNNIYQQAFKRSKTDMPEMYNLPPLRRQSGESNLRKRLKFGILRSNTEAVPVEQLPPIQLKPICIAKDKTEDDPSSDSDDDVEDEILKAYDDESDYKNRLDKLLILRHGNAGRSYGYSGELKLHPDKAEFDDLIERSKNQGMILKSLRTPLRRDKTVNDMIFINDTTTSDDATLEQREPISKFEIRKQYGKNLEKNWFKSFIQQAKVKRGDKRESNFDLRMDLFYSPEPRDGDSSDLSDADSRGEINVDDSDNKHNPSEMKTFEKRKHLLDMKELFSSTDVLTGEDHELDRETPSDIEIVMKGNELIQKKTKHKMRKKRRKKEKRCMALRTTETGNEDVPIPPLTDKELRAIRLNIKKKQPPPIISGKRKFLQAANAIFVAVQFRKILAKIRERNKIRRSRKLKKKIRRVKWKQMTGDYAEFEREKSTTPTPPTLKEIFMQEIGRKLLIDVEFLNITSKLEPNMQECIDSEPNKKKPLSGFAKEVSKACVEDVTNLLTDKNRTVKKFGRLRRHSAPLLSMPEGLPIEISEKSKGRRRDRSKSVRRIKSGKKKINKRSQSPNVVQKCSCSRHRETISFGHSSRSQSIVCTHKGELPKVKYFMFHRSQVLKRRLSLNEEDLKKSKEIDLHELLRDVEIPAKDIRIQIIKRKMKKQKRRKDKAINVVIRTPEESEAIESESSSEPETDSSTDDDECNNIYMSPFVSAGVAWNHQVKRPTWTSTDVDRELQRVTRFFLEMKDCSYIRFTGINQAIIAKLDEITT